MKNRKNEIIKDYFFIVDSSIFLNKGIKYFATNVKILLYLFSSIFFVN